METRNRAICYTNSLREVRQEDKTLGAQRKQIFHSRLLEKQFYHFPVFQEDSTFTYIWTCKAPVNILWMLS